MGTGQPLSRPHRVNPGSLSLRGGNKWSSRVSSSPVKPRSSPTESRSSQIESTRAESVSRSHSRMAMATATATAMVMGDDGDGGRVRRAVAYCSNCLSTAGRTLAPTCRLSVEGTGHSGRSLAGLAQPGCGWAAVIGDCGSALAWAGCPIGWAPPSIAPANEARNLGSSSAQSCWPRLGRSQEGPPTSSTVRCLLGRPGHARAARDVSARSGNGAVR